MASPAAVEGAMAATVVLPRLPPRRMVRLLLQTPRAPAPCLPHRHHHKSHKDLKDSSGEKKKDASPAGKSSSQKACKYNGHC